ncbi:MAG: calcium/sodium antiporter [Candidatus Marinimicrobia bacterium]|nr:calcium/sodium antiporter [Candidatus Neomarinimicrobiota bacterium]MBT7377155.1 calcium/sodium antiporter [Candidatus Neomarinimicrobiota bacterium]|tara:strand:- start:13170 stop:14105 length:936 start_codon:yes stop_codon:yes gene_type:complete
MLNMFPELVQFVAGGLLLFFGAEYLIESSKSIAEKFSIPKIVVGITLVAFGTSLPELIVSIMATLRGESGIVVGNVIGSNIANIGLILGIGSIISPLCYSFSKLKGDLYFLLFITMLPILSIQLDYMNFYTGLGYIGILFLYCYYLINSDHEVDVIDEGTSQNIAMFVIIGISGLGFGSHFFVEGAVGLAEIFGIPPIIIGMTIVAIGTSLPELATTLVAIKKNEASLAIGNIIGSNIMNIVAVLGISFIIKDISITSITINAQLFVMGLLTMILFAALYFRNKLSREIGIILLGIYVVFIFLNFNSLWIG